MDDVIIPILGMVFVFVVAPLIVMRGMAEHHERKARLGGAMDEESVVAFEHRAQRIEDRMKALEAILDDEVPGWRRKYDD